jgi:biopolymer transport protein ExbD
MAEIQENPQEGGKGKAKKQSTKVDLTAMVDLAFLLITFFMFTTTLAKPKAMQIALPKEDAPEEDAPELSKKHALTLLLAPKNVVLYYFGKAEEAAADANAVKATSFDKKSGLRKVIIEKLKELETDPDRANNFDKDGKSKLMVLIKPVDSSVYGNMVNALDEMHINKIARYAIINISEPEKVLVEQSMAKAKESK